MVAEQNLLEVELSKCKLRIDPEERIASIICPEKKGKGSKGCRNVIFNLPFTEQAQQEDEEKQ